MEHVRRLRVLVQNLVTRVVVDRSEGSGTYQVLWGGGRVSSGLEHLEPQGMHFRAPADAGGVVVSAGGQREAGVLVVAGGIVPNDAIGEGEGGLHYLGEWRVFLRSDGGVCLGQKTPADWVALASLTDARIEALQSKLDALISAYNAHVHGGVTSGSSSSGTPPTGASPVGSLASVASEKVRCV